MPILETWSPGANGEGYCIRIKLKLPSGCSETGIRAFI